MPKLGLGLGLSTLIQGDVIAWTPSEISTRFWYDAADTLTITLSSGTINRVAQWNDKSGNEYHLTPSSNQLPPKTGTRALNGLNTIEWDSFETIATNVSGNCLENLTFTHNQSATPLYVAMVMQADSFGLNNTQHFLLAGRTSTTAGARMGVRWTDTNRLEVLGGPNPANLAQNLSFYNSVSLNSVTRGQPYLIVPKFNNTNSVWRVSGSVANTGNVGTNNFTVLQLGHNETEGSDLDGYIAEAVAFTDNTKQEIVEGYLAWKWGLEANLPEGHPYKNNRPVV